MSGRVSSTLAIYDTMQISTCPVATYCVGLAASGGAVLLAGGAKGKRYALPHAKVMIHQPYGGVYGQTADIEIQAEEILKTKDTLINVMAKCTGQTAEKVREDSERDRFFDAPGAVKYGIVDEHGGEAVAEAARLGTSVREKDREGRTDFRPLTTVTIDGEHARVARPSPLEHGSL